MPFWAALGPIATLLNTAVKKIFLGTGEKKEKDAYKARKGALTWLKDFERRKEKRERHL